MTFDVKNVEVIDNTFFKDENGVYYVTDSMRVCCFYKLPNVDPNTFRVLNNYYQVDSNRVYYSTFYHGLKGVLELFEADINTFEVLSEDESYALDKNNMYQYGMTLKESGNKITNTYLYNQLKGKIILKVEENGEAYYISPSNKVMYYLSRPLVAFYVMREQGIGITNNDLEKIPVANNYCPAYSPGCDNLAAHNSSFTSEQKGKIFLQVEENGETWYVNPSDLKRYFLGRPTDAFNVMRNLGLGISNENFDSLIN
ncbi:MAG: DKNYY domain-containing protein [bacterium]